MNDDGTQIRIEGRPVGTHQRLATRAGRPCRRDGAGQPFVCRSGAVPIPRWHPLARLARAQVQAVAMMHGDVVYERPVEQLHADSVHFSKAGYQRIASVLGGV